MSRELVERLNNIARFYDASKHRSPRSAATIREAIERLSTPTGDAQGDEIERMGEALFTLSDNLRKIGAFESDHVRITYETVVKRWDELTAALSARAAKPDREAVKVERIETRKAWPPGEEGEPIWRIEIGGYCADFDYEQAANNFADALIADGLIAQHGSESGEATSPIAIAEARG